MPIWKRISAGHYEWKEDKIIHLSEDETSSVDVGWWVLFGDREMPVELGPYSTLKLAKEMHSREHTLYTKREAENARTGREED